MRPFALSALVLAAVSSVAVAGLVACDQDYASSTDARETFMGATKEVPRAADASVPATPPMAPPQMGAPPPPLPPAGDASTDAASAADGAKAGPAAPALQPHYR
jgi:hypothetical protein